MITSLLVLYAVSAAIGLTSVVLAWYNAQQDGGKGLLPFVLTMALVPAINTLWAFGFLVFLTFGEPKKF